MDKMIATIDQGL